MRESLNHRPLLLFAIGLILGCVAVNQWFASVLLIAILVLCRDLRASFVCAIAFLLGAIITPTNVRQIFPQQLLDSDARVVSMPKLYDTDTVTEIDVQGVKLLMVSPPNTAPILGQTIHVRGVVQPLDLTATHLTDRNIQGRIYVQKPQFVSDAPWIYRIGQGWRDSFIAFADRTLPPRAAEAVEAVCFNVPSRLDQSDRQEFIRAGTVHAISTSGLHVGVLVVLLLGLMSFFPVPRGAQLAVVFAFLALYVVASRLHAPVIRTSVTAIVLSAAYLLRREPDLLSALALAIVIQLLWDPTTIYDAGFQLTYVVLAAVALFGLRHRSPTVLRRGKWIEQAKFIASRAALVFLVAAPLTAYDYGSVSITSFVSNALTVVALPVLVAAALIAHLFSFISTSIAMGMMVAVVEPLSGWLLFVSDRFGGTWAALAIPAFSGYWLLLAYGLMLVVWRCRLRPA